MREYTNKQESYINLDAESDFNKIYLDYEEECEIIPQIAPQPNKLTSYYSGRAK